MKNKIQVIIFLSVLSSITFSQYPNFRIYPSANGSTHQIEPTIVRHPTNPQLLFASAFTIFQSFFSEGIYVSTDGGLSWQGNDTCTGAPISGGHRGDPGPIIDKDGRFIIIHLGSFPTGVFSNTSTNLGVNWNSNVLLSSDDIDKLTAGTDDVSTSTFYGRSYGAWTRFVPPFPIVFSYTTNGGSSWSGVIQINTSFGSNRSFGPAISVGINGNVFVCWASTLASSPFTEDCIGFAVSSNGGVNWTVQECAYDMNGIKTSQLTPWLIRANSYPAMDVDKSGGSRNGWIYIVTSEKNLSPAGSDADIIFHRSTNGGTNWSSGVRVNQDVLNNGRLQFFPAIEVDNGGGINVIYYDSRNSIDSVDVFLSRSIDGGNTWTDFRITDHRFRPAPVGGLGGGNMGDNIGMTSTATHLIPVWMDNKTGALQIWSARIDYSSIGIKKISSEIPATFRLHQNFPNPFNPNTKIKFDVPSNVKRKTSNVKLVVFNVQGKEVASLVNQHLIPGLYEVDWDGTNYPSGVYFYSMYINGELRDSKKMLLIK